MNNLPGTITLDDRYYIDVDPYNWMLKETKITPSLDSKGRPNKQAGKRCDVVVGYCPSLVNALELYSERLFKEKVHCSVEPCEFDNVVAMLEEIKTAVTGLSLTLNVKKEGK